MTKVKIVFPEWANPIIQQAIQQCPEIEVLKTDSDYANNNTTALIEACQMVASGEADALIAGIDYTSREVILTCRDHLGIVGETFSSCFVLTRGEECYIMTDAATCKHPTDDQLYDITEQTYATAKAILPIVPKVAFLSFSTAGSGGRDDSISQAQAVIQRVRQAHPDWLVDGEMQLDAAVVPEVGAKKFPLSPVAGRANVWILPDINAGNILYKAMERFGGFTAAGPILQGFKHPCSDLSRGSTVEDIKAVIAVEQRLVLAEKANLGDN